MTSAEIGKMWMVWSAWTNALVESQWKWTVGLIAITQCLRGKQPLQHSTWLHVRATTSRGTSRCRFKFCDLLLF